MSEDADPQSKDTILYRSSKDKPKPETNKNYPRVYGHNSCPYAERARLALSLKGVEFQHLEIDLEDKAQWHIDLNGGRVPVIELPDGQTVHDSRICIDFAHDYAPGGIEFYSKDPVKAAHQRLAIMEFAQFE